MEEKCLLTLNFLLIRFNQYKKNIILIIKRMTHRYVIANIKIPIEITENGEQISHMGRSSIEITPCDELPPEQDIDDMDFTELIQQLINNEDRQTVTINKWNESTVSKDKLKKKVKSKNLSFRRKTGNNHNFTMKQG